MSASVQPSYASKSKARLCLALGCVVSCCALQARAAEPADAVYRNGKVYTVDSRDSVQQAIAFRGGVITYVGADAGAQAYIGPSTTIHDLRGRMLMPGLVDGHMHPLAGGATLVKCNLEYRRLTVQEMQQRIQACLDASRDREPDGWLEVSNWFQEAMRGGTETSRATLDALRTKRPIMALSSFGHTALVNTRALQLSGITAATQDPLGGRVGRDSSGAPTGVLQDAAMQAVQAVIPQPTPAEDVAAAEAALVAMRKQGITTFLDAAADPRTLAAFKGAERQGKLTARAHFAVLIKPPQGPRPGEAVAYARELAQRFDDGPIVAHPGITVRNIKLFLDGVITAPALTGAMLQPYFVNQGTAQQPHWAPARIAARRCTFRLRS